tara:strand:- start:121 stop:405 length:285 start_codon:yes stop_codon:yes gene_type:complete
MKLTKNRLKQIIQEEVAKMSEDVIDVDFGTKKVRGTDQREKEIPLEKTIAVMLSDVRDRAQDISQLARAVKAGHKIEADMLEIISIVDELELEL